MEETVTIDGNCYLKMLKKHLCVISKVSCGQKFSVQQYGACFQTANSVISENVPDNIRKKN